MSGEPIRRTEGAPLEARAQLQSEVHALCDLLVVRPLPKRQTLRARALRALTACESAGDTGLMAHLLRNLLRDLATQSLDAAYYVVHLSRAASRVDG